jgi:large subunit ribosomal protein L29
VYEPAVGEAMKAAELRELSAAEIKEKVGAAEEELFNLRFQARMGQLANPLRIRILRKDVARAKTVLREKERAQGSTRTAARAEG